MAQGNKVHAAHGKFRCAESDAISALNALLAYEAQPAASRGDFCRQHWLHENHLRDMAALHLQLSRVVALPSVVAAARSAGLASADVLQGLQDTAALVSDAPLQACSASGVELLRRCVAAGWSDQVARRMRTAEYLDQLANQARSRPYQRLVQRFFRGTGR